MSEKVNTPEVPPAEEGTSRFKIMLGSFATILLAELGDKTQITTLLMTTSSGQPWMVFTGAALALLATSLLGVFVGQWLSQRLDPRRVEVISGIIFLLVAAWLTVDILQSRHA
ncbi:MAG: TMEM165/GDT1 family protein [Gloeomargarita sp. HHBFW_bins_162]